MEKYIRHMSKGKPVFFYNVNDRASFMMELHNLGYRLGDRNDDLSVESKSCEFDVSKWGFTFKIFTRNVYFTMEKDGAIMYESDRNLI